MNSGIMKVFILLWLPYGAWTRVARWLVHDVNPRKFAPEMAATMIGPRSLMDGPTPTGSGRNLIVIGHWSFGGHSR